MIQQKRTISEIETVVRESGNSGHIYLPKDWVGKVVIVKLKEVKK